MTKRLVVFGTAVMTTLLALVVLWQFHIVIVYVLVSLALAATVRPLVKDWSRRSFGDASGLDFALPDWPGHLRFLNLSCWKIRDRRYSTISPNIIGAG